MTWFWLRIIDLLDPVYRWQRVDTAQLRAIVGIKLEMDNRRAPAFRMQQTKKEHSSSFGLTLLVYLLLGGVLSLTMNIPSFVFAVSIYHTYLMVMITMSLISDFSAILLDTSDNTIIFPRPISAKTFYAARATHILLYIGQISFALAVIPIVASFFKFGAMVGIALILTSILCVVFSVSFTNGLYLLIMRFASEERLKSIINYFQIAMAFIMMGGYQILPRMIGLSNVENLSLNLKWWAVFVPPLWMTGLVKLVHDPTFDSIGIATACLALFVPAVSWNLINKYLAPYFSTKIIDLGTSTSSAQASISKRSTGKSTIMARLFTRVGTERATFNLVSYVFARDRKLKLRIYPTMGSFLVIIIVILFNKMKGDVTLSGYIESLRQSESYILIIYISIFIMVSVAFEIHYSDEWKAAWIFQAAPIQKPGEILSGTIKAVLARFFVPLFMVISIFVLIIWRANALPDLCFGMLTCVLLILSIFILVDKHVPLSLEPTVRNQGVSVVRMILSMLVIALLGFGHYFLTKFDWILWLACPVLVAGCFLVLAVYRSITWDDIAG